MVEEFGEDRLQDLELIGRPGQPWPVEDLSTDDRRTFAAYRGSNLDALTPLAPEDAACVAEA